MRAACCTLPAGASSAPGFSGRGRSEGVAAGATMRGAPSPSSASAVGGVGGLDLLRRRSPLAAAAAAAPRPSSSSSARFRPRAPARRQHLRPLSSRPRATPEDDDEGAPSASSPSPSPSPPRSDESPAVDIEVGSQTKETRSKGATPLGDLLALVSPARKRGAGGPPPLTLSKRLRAIRGSLAAVADHAWQRTLTLPGFSHVATALRALDALTRPARDAIRDASMDLNERFEMFRVEEAKQCWAWESRSKAQGRAWRTFCEHCGWFAAALPYLVLCPSHAFFSCAVPLFVGLVNFDHPLLNGVTLAWVAAMAAGKLRRGLLSGLVGLPPGFSGV